MKQFFFTLMCILFHNLLLSQEAIIVRPVADLLGEPLESVLSKDIPVCGSPNASNNCARLHQLLFNEKVVILGEKNGYYQIQTPDSYFITTQSSTPHNTYWTRKENVLPLSKIVHQEKLPLKKTSGQVVMLARPWKDPKSSICYCAGTRFAAIQNQKKSSCLSVHIYDPVHNTFHEGQISRDYLLEPTNKNTKQLLVELIRSWITGDQGYIPYVWGGTSYMHRSRQPFEEKIMNKKRYYNMVDIESYAPKTGFDCSGLVLRAAQMVGIDYHYKNTYTLAQGLRPVTSYKDLEVGDLIWIPGHVMIVSDLTRHCMIEARSYKNGYGKLHEISLDEQFKDIKTYQDLLEACQQKKPLQRLNAQKNAVEIIKDYKLLHLPA